MMGTFTLEIIAGDFVFAPSHRRIAISLLTATLNSAAPFSIAAASSGASTSPVAFVAAGAAALSRAAHQTVYNVTLAYRLRTLKKLIPNCVKSLGLGFKLVHVITTNRLVQIPIGNGIQNRLRHFTI
jgi:hypothetical protein